MKERIVEANTHLVYADCECGGILVRFGNVMTTNPPQYEYKCNKCEKTQRIEGQPYPKIQIRPVKKDEPNLENQIAKELEAI